MFVLFLRLVHMHQEDAHTIVVVKTEKTNKSQRIDIDNVVFLLIRLSNYSYIFHNWNYSLSNRMNALHTEFTCIRMTFPTD